MQQHIQTLVKHIFRKDSLKDVSVNELEQFTTAYPYAAVGHYLLARKLKENGNEEEFIKQADITSLYFNNPLWAHWQLQAAHATVQHEHSTTVEETVAHATAVVAAHETAFSVVSLAEEAAELHKTNGETPEENTITAQPLEDGSANGFFDGPNADAPAEDPSTNVIIEQPAIIDNTEETLPQTETTSAVPAETPLAAIPDPGAPVLEQVNGTPLQDTIASDEEEVFEPYHTIDYFASQGIKLSKEDTGAPKGKLDRQLKSFTEWLRSMKRTTPSATELDENSNQSIVKIAEYSVSGNEIVTEAMAEVWAKQGNLSQAIAIYEKLSLLNPTKNAYFASRIQKVIAQKPD